MGRLWKLGDRVQLDPSVGVGTVVHVGSGGDTRVEFDNTIDTWIDEDCLMAASEDDMKTGKSCDD